MENIYLTFKVIEKVNKNVHKAFIPGPWSTAGTKKFSFVYFP